MTQYLKLTGDIKTAILYEYSKSFNSVDKLFCYFLLFFSDADFKLAPFFHGYYRNRLDQHDRELHLCCYCSTVEILIYFIFVFCLLNKYIINKQIV